MFDIQNLISQNESEALDFKREFHKNNAELLHDILCLSNSFYEGNRFLLFGVANDKTIYGIENDPNKKTNANIQDFLRQVHLNKLPQVELTLHQVGGHELGLLKIFNAPSKPYFLRKDFQDGKFLVRAGVIYTRLGDTNIPRHDTAPEDHIEIMWKERFGLLKAKTVSLEKNIPIKIGDTREEVLGALGEPDATGWQVVQYYSEGLEISYDQHFDTVDGLSVYSLPAGTAFEGTVFGIKLGDSFASVKDTIGRPSYWGLAYENSSVAVWEINDNLLVVEFWRSSNAKQGLMPAQQLGTVKSISYCRTKSFVAYTALVAIAIEQLSKGITPPIFTPGDIVTMGIELDSPIFNEQYEVLGARPALMGGAEVLVAFPETKVLLAFWIYPLEWKYPEIRAIYKLGGESEATDINENTNN
jgi:hypothetical protein